MPASRRCMSCTDVAVLLYHQNPAQAARLALLEKLEPFPLKLRPAEEQEAILSGLSHAEMGAALDLRPFMQRTPFVLQARRFVCTPQREPGA